MFGIGIPELVIILVIVLIIFGAGRLPEIGSGVGKAISNFRRSTRESPEKEKIKAGPEKEKIEAGSEKS